MENISEEAVPVTAVEENPDPVDAPPADAAGEAASAAGEAQAEAQAETPAEAPKPAAAVAAKPARAPGSTGFEAQLAALLTQLYLEYDLQQVEGCPPGTRSVDLWALPVELKASAPPAPESGSERSEKGKDKWPARASLAERPRDYRVHVYLSKTKDPAWSVPGKDVQAISADRGSGLLLLMADQKGYFLPSNRVWDLCQLYTPVQGSAFKVSAAKLRKAAISRFFSLAGLSREIAEALRK